MCCTFVTYYILETFEKTFEIIGLNQKSVKIYYTHQYKIQTFWTSTLELLLPKMVFLQTHLAFHRWPIFRDVGRSENLKEGNL